ncbi:hypothetical protein DBT_0608 [Dissulfuribacter thermophilus]|uniref:Uncharacterized protein n=1 Tax=Dissulfuribacter thermophilus TaxID=1156395 RepID=A0A1B9F8A3_9BACT|nr:hypothetical protein DBT_0608 [Dissulfuribacter thermophilus]
MGFSKEKNLKKIQKTVHLLSGYLNETGSQANKEKSASANNGWVRF